jgi:hypothetical protein
LRVEHCTIVWAARGKAELVRPPQRRIYFYLLTPTSVRNMDTSMAGKATGCSIIPVVGNTAIKTYGALTGRFYAMQNLGKRFASLVEALVLWNISAHSP